MGRLLHSKTTKKGYSLLEVTVSLGIIAMATVVMINFLVLSLRISLITLGRSYVREEISDVSLYIARDIRNANRIINCGTMTCRLELSTGIYEWSACDDQKICKAKIVGGVSQKVFSTSSTVKINYLDFTTGYAESNNNERATIIFTLSASHANTTLGINNVVRQTSISTRNYEV